MTPFSQYPISVEVETLPSDGMRIRVAVEGFGESSYQLHEGLTTAQTEEDYKAWLVKAATLVESCFFTRTLPTENFQFLMCVLQHRIDWEIGTTVQIQSLLTEIAKA